MKCLQMDLSSPSLGNGPYQAVAGSQWSSVDSQLVMYVKPRHKVVDRAQSRQPWVILWDCLDFSHGKLDEGSSTGAEGSGYVTAFTGLCLDSMGLHRPEQTIQLKAVREKRKKKKKKINRKLYSFSAQVLSCAICSGKILGRFGAERVAESRFHCFCFDWEKCSTFSMVHQRCFTPKHCFREPGAYSGLWHLTSLSRSSYLVGNNLCATAICEIRLMSKQIIYCFFIQQRLIPLSL